MCYYGSRVAVLNCMCGSKACWLWRIELSGKEGHDMLTISSFARKQPKGIAHSSGQQRGLALEEFSCECL